MLLYYSSFLLLFVLTNALSSKNNYCQDKLNTTGNNISRVIERFKALWPVSDWKEKGYFTDDYICDINIHWLSFGPPSKIHFIILGVIYANIMLTGFIGNSLVLFLFFRCKSLRTPGNNLIANLAASDGLITLKTPIFIYNCFYMGPALGDKACRIYGFVGGLSGTVSIVTLSAISFDRYFMIKFPLNRANSNLRVKICLIIIWLYSLVFSLMPVLDVGFGKYTYEGYLTSCSFDYLTQDANEKYFIIAFFIAAWVVPFILITFCYVNIVKVVMARSVASKDGRDSFRHVKKEHSKKQEIKLSIVVFCSICLWVLAWTPYSIVALLGVFNKKHLISPLTSMAPAVFCKLASCINPFLYALSHPKFKSELKNIMGSYKARSRDHSVIWSTQNSKNKSKFSDYKESSDVEVEVIELDVRYSDYPRQISFDAFSPPVGTEKKASLMEMFCMRPNFSNKASTFRRISRKWSIKEKENKLREGD